MRNEDADYEYRFQYCDLSSDILEDQIDLSLAAVDDLNDDEIVTYLEEDVGYLPTKDKICWFTIEDQQHVSAVEVYDVYLRHINVLQDKLMFGLLHLPSKYREIYLSGLTRCAEYKGLRSFNNVLELFKFKNPENKND